LVFEQDYGLPFGVSNEALKRWTGNGLRPREEVLGACDAVNPAQARRLGLSPDAGGDDRLGLDSQRAVAEVTQIAIEKRMTLVAFENMNHQGSAAGYTSSRRTTSWPGIAACSTPVHPGHRRALRAQAQGCRPELRLVSRGAIGALLSHGIHDVTVLTRRAPHLIGNHCGR
jgi:hypothetical protein